MSQKYAAYDSTGKVTGIYDSEDSPVPNSVSAIKITDAEWQSYSVDQRWTVVNGIFTPPPAPTPAELLATAKADQTDLIKTDYTNAVFQPVTFTTAAGVTTTFQADQASQDILSVTLQRARVAGAVPANFYWKAADNSKPAFTLADLEGLDAAMFTQGWEAFQHKDNQIDAINAVTDTSSAGIAAVQAIVW